MQYKHIHKSEPSQNKCYNNQHRAEHWYVDNQIYFITARCMRGFPAFSSNKAKNVFWDRFGFYTKKHNYIPYITSLMHNHYHTLGFLKSGIELKEMMRNIHGSVAKLVNDTLTIRLVPFWGETKRKSYFDGCIRNEKQARLAYAYTLTQSQRHKVCNHWEDYNHTHINISLEKMLRHAKQMNAFLKGIPYKRYM